MFWILPFGGGTLVTLAGVCNDNVRPSSFLYLEHFQPQCDCVEHGDLQAEAFRAAVWFSDMPVLLCSVWFLRRRFLLSMWKLILVNRIYFWKHGCE